MNNLILLVIIIVVGAYYKYNYSKKVEMPIIEENEDLAFLNKLSIAGLIISGISALISFKITFCILLVLIPVILYLNLKTNWIAFTKNKSKNKKYSD